MGLFAEGCRLDILILCDKRIQNASTEFVVDVLAVKTRYDVELMPV